MRCLFSIFSIVYGVWKKIEILNFKKVHYILSKIIDYFEKMTQIYENTSNDLFYLANFYEFQNKELLVCIHGNSSCAETFSEILSGFSGVLQTVAIDLPGCGRSKRLPEYSMELVAEVVSNFINSFNAPRVHLFGHSLGGHLLTFLDITPGLIILAGTPPLSSAVDFSTAFKPDSEAIELLPLLSLDRRFEEDEARKFVLHTGVVGPVSDLMIQYAIETDPLFRKGCLSSLANLDQMKWLSESRNVIIFHGELDGVINLQYLQTIPQNLLFEGVIHCLPCKHMSPLLQANTIIATIRRALMI